MAAVKLWLEMEIGITGGEEVSDLFSHAFHLVVWRSRIVSVCVVGDKACPFNRRTIIGRILDDSPFTSVEILLKGRSFFECGNAV